MSNYLHLGSGTMIHLKDLIGIINLEEPSALASVAELTEQAEVDKRLFSAAEGLEPKSLVITRKGLYWSAISADTLYKRAAGNEE